MKAGAFVVGDKCFGPSREARATSWPAKTKNYAGKKNSFVSKGAS